MSSVQIIYIITQTPGYLRIWKRLTETSKRFVIEAADGETFMLDTILEDALEMQRGK